MNKHNEITVRMHKILSILNESPNTTQEQMKDMLGVSLRTVKSDYRYLKDTGLITSLNANQTKRTINNDIVIGKSQDALRALVALYFITGEEKKIDDICNLLDGGCYFSRSTMYRKLLPLLYDNKLLIKNGHSVIPGEVFFQSLPEDTNEILNFAAFCLSSQGTFGKEVYSHAINYLNGKNEALKVKQESDLNSLKSYLDKITQNAKKPTYISFSYKNISIRFFYLGFIAYSCEKNTIYLAGFEISSPSDKRIKFRIFKASDIEWNTIKPAENVKIVEFLTRNRNNEPNKLKQLQTQLKEIQSEMFDISEDKTEKVNILVRYSIENYYELYTLYNSRIAQCDAYGRTDPSLRPSIRYLDTNREPISHLDVGEPPAYIQYRDRIRGLSNFANYIRRFGDGVTVLTAPGKETLRKTIINGAQRALAHYKTDEQEDNL